MEEESSDMDNMKDRNTLCTEEAEEPTSAGDEMHKIIIGIPSLWDTILK